MHNSKDLELFQTELNPGEQVIWTGRPKQGFLLRPEDALMIPFSLVCGGFFISTLFFLDSMEPSFTVFVGIPVVLSVLYLVVGRFLVDIAQRRKTYYALTAQRAIIVSGLFRRNVRTLILSNLSEIHLETRRKGRGTITFGARPAMAWMNVGSAFPGQNRKAMAPNFEWIEDARAIYQEIVRLQAENE